MTITIKETSHCPLSSTNASSVPALASVHLQTRKSVRRYIIIHMFHLTFNTQSHTAPPPQSAFAYWYQIMTRAAGHLSLFTCRTEASLVSLAYTLQMNGFLLPPRPPTPLHLGPSEDPHFLLRPFWVFVDRETDFGWFSFLRSLKSERSPVLPAQPR